MNIRTSNPNNCCVSVVLNIRAGRAVALSSLLQSSNIARIRIVISPSTFSSCGQLVSQFYPVCDTMSYGSMEARGVEKGTRVEEQEAELDYDVLVETIGEFGWFQKLTCALLWVPAAVGGIHVLMYSFTGAFFWKS